MSLIELTPQKVIDFVDNKGPLTVSLYKGYHSEDDFVCNVYDAKYEDKSFTFYNASAKEIITLPNIEDDSLFEKHGRIAIMTAADTYYLSKSSIYEYKKDEFSEWEENDGAELDPEAMGACFVRAHEIENYLNEKFRSFTEGQHITCEFQTFFSFGGCSLPKYNYRYKPYYNYRFEIGLDINGRHNFITWCQLDDTNQKVCEAITGILLDRILKICRKFDFNRLPF